MEIYKYKAEQVQIRCHPRKRKRVVPIGLGDGWKTQKTLAVLKAMHKAAEMNGKEMLVKRDASKTEV